MTRLTSFSSLFSLLSSSLLCLALGARAATSASVGTSAEIVASSKATHLGEITGERVVVASGSTYSFTVDTPEDKGLVSTKPTVKELLAQIAAKDGSTQSHRITASDGTEKTTGEIAPGDRLVVTSQDARATVLRPGRP